MKTYSVILLQWMIWSGFTLSDWLSRHDKGQYKVLMFLVFLYLALILGKTVIKSWRKTILITGVSITLYSCMYFAYQSIYIYI